MDSVGTSISGLLPIDSELHGRYRILGIVGRGGMSNVYEAEHQGLGKKVAIKEMLLPMREGPEAEEAVVRFQTEARTLARLEHRYFPNVTDFFSQDGRYYLVMEYVHGETLDDLVRRTPGFLAEDIVLRWGSQLCDVLSYLHSQAPSVVFRDLKPSNIMVDDQGQVKLIDFGIARFFKPGKQSDTQNMGTAGYSAPEQYGTGQTDARSDIYSLGACLHFLLTKRDPTNSPFNFPPVREINPRVSPNTERVVAKCLSMRAEDRYASAADVKKALTGPPPEPETSFLSRPAPGAQPPARPAAIPATVTPPPLLPPARGGPSWAIIGAILLAIVAAIGVSAYMIKEGQAAAYQESQAGLPAPPVSVPETPPQVQIPDLSHLDVVSAQQALQDANLVMERYDKPGDVPAGTVIRQIPAAGTMAPSGQKVKVWVSSGPGVVAVPDVTQMSVDQATRLLTAAGLKVGQSTLQNSDTIPKDYVIQSSPRAGFKTTLGQPIDLVVSEGQKAVPPPATAPTAPPQPNFDVVIPVPHDGKPHQVQVTVQQADGTLASLPALSKQDDADLTVQAPSADAIKATVDGAEVSPTIKPLAADSASNTESDTRPGDNSEPGQ